MRHIFFCLTVSAALMVLLLNGCVQSGGAPTASPTPGQYGSGSVVAVWNPENLSIEENQILDSMQEFLAATISETLKEQGGYEIIEREKLLLALEELRLGSSVLVDESTRLDVGRMLGAQLMVFGAYQQIGEQLRIDLRMVEVETGAVLHTGEQTVTALDTTGVLEAARRAALQLM